MKKALANPAATKNPIHAVEWSRKLLGWESASEEAKIWWTELEELNDDRASLLAKLAGELICRHATIEDFFTACLYSGKENVRDNLNFLDTIRQDRSVDVPNKPKMTVVKDSEFSAAEFTEENLFTAASDEDQDVTYH